MLQGLQKFNSLGVSLILEGIVRLSLALAFIFMGFKANGAIAAVPIATAVAVILSFFPLKLKKSKGNLKLNRKEIYKFTFMSFIALFLVNAIYNLDIFLVKHFFSAEQAGYYAAISLLGKIVFFGATAIGLVMFPKVSEMHIKDKKAAKSIFKKALGFTLLISAAVVAVYFLIPTFLVSLLFGSQYLAIIPLIGFFGVFMAMLSLSYICVLMKLATGKRRFIFNLLIAVIAEIILICIFHESLEQIILNLIAVNSLLLISLIKS